MGENNPNEKTIYDTRGSLRLPGELLLIIFGFTSLIDVRNLVQTNKQLGKLILSELPLIYADIISKIPEDKRAEEIKNFIEGTRLTNGKPPLDKPYVAPAFSYELEALAKFLEKENRKNIDVTHHLRSTSDLLESNEINLKNIRSHVKRIRDVDGETFLVQSLEKLADSLNVPRYLSQDQTDESKKVAADARAINSYVSRLIEIDSKLLLPEGNVRGDILNEIAMRDISSTEYDFIQIVLKNLKRQFGDATIRLDRDTRRFSLLTEIKRRVIIGKICARKDAANYKQELFDLADPVSLSDLNIRNIALRNFCQNAALIDPLIDHAEKHRNANFSREIFKALVDTFTTLNLPQLTKIALSDKTNNEILKALMKKARRLIDNPQERGNVDKVNKLFAAVINNKNVQAPELIQIAKYEEITLKNLGRIKKRLSLNKGEFSEEAMVDIFTAIASNEKASTDLLIEITKELLIKINRISKEYKNTPHVAQSYNLAKEYDAVKAVVSNSSFPLNLLPSLASGYGSRRLRNAILDRFLNDNDKITGGDNIEAMNKVIAKAISNIMQSSSVQPEAISKVVKLCSQFPVGSYAIIEINKLVLDHSQSTINHINDIIDSSNTPTETFKYLIVKLPTKTSQEFTDESKKNIVNKVLLRAEKLSKADASKVYEEIINYPKVTTDQLNMIAARPNASDKVFEQLLNKVNKLSYDKDKEKLLTAICSNEDVSLEIILRAGLKGRELNSLEAQANSNNAMAGNSKIPIRQLPNFVNLPTANEKTFNIILDRFNKEAGTLEKDAVMSLISIAGNTRASVTTLNLLLDCVDKFPIDDKSVFQIYRLVLNHHEVKIEHLKKIGKNDKAVPEILKQLLLKSNKLSRVERLELFNVIKDRKNLAPETFTELVRKVSSSSKGFFRETEGSKKLVSDLIKDAKNENDLITIANSNIGKEGYLQEGIAKHDHATNRVFREVLKNLEEIDQWFHQYLLKEIANSKHQPLDEDVMSQVIDKALNTGADVVGETLRAIIFREESTQKHHEIIANSDRLRHVLGDISQKLRSIEFEIGHFNKLLDLAEILQKLNKHREAGNILIDISKRNSTPSIVLSRVVKQAMKLNDRHKQEDIFKAVSEHPYGQLISHNDEVVTYSKPALFSDKHGNLKDLPSLWGGQDLGKLVAFHCAHLSGGKSFSLHNKEDFVDKIHAGNLGKCSIFLASSSDQNKAYFALNGGGVIKIVEIDIDPNKKVKLESGKQYDLLNLDKTIIEISPTPIQGVGTVMKSISTTKTAASDTKNSTRRKSVG